MQLKIKLIVALLLILSSLVLFPLEERIREHRRAAFGTLPLLPDRDWRDVVGQQAMLAMLAGFRGIVADIYYLRGHGYWEKQEWLLQYKNMQMACRLQPHSLTFYELTSWHFAWNVSYAARVDTTLTPEQQLKAERKWIELGRDIMLEGVRNNPDSSSFYFYLGFLYSNKWRIRLDEKEGYCEGAKWYAKAYEFPDAIDVAGRNAARCLDLCGKPDEAYQFWIKLWQEPGRGFKQEHVIEAAIRDLEQRLNIPDEKRIFPHHPRT
jgi:hypothetical protein